MKTLHGITMLVVRDCSDIDAKRGVRKAELAKVTEAVFAPKL